MHVPPRSFIRLAWIGCVAAVAVFAAVSACTLRATGPSMPALISIHLAAPGGCADAAKEGLASRAAAEDAGGETPAAQAKGSSAVPATKASANVATQAACTPIPDMDIPVSSIIEAKMTGTLDSAHLKVGKEIWVRMIYGLDYPECTLNEGAALYGHVTESVSQKDPDSSVLSLVFDRADCQEHGKKPMPLRLIGLMGPSESARMHDAVPMGLNGSARNAANAVRGTNYVDEMLNPGGPAHTVHAGVVLGEPKLKLDLEGGPQCSARISSSNRSIQLEMGTEVFLVVESTP